MTVFITILTASVLSCVTPSLPPGQPVPTWSWGSVYLSASSVLLCCCCSSSSCRAPWLSLSVHTARPLSANTSGLSRTTSCQPVPVLLSPLPYSFLSNSLFFLLFCYSFLWSIFPAWRSRISCVIHASSSTERSFRYTAWLWLRADSRLSENRSAWLWSSLSQTLSAW